MTTRAKGSLVATALLVVIGVVMYGSVSRASGHWGQILSFRENILFLTPLLPFAIASCLAILALVRGTSWRRWLFKAFLVVAVTALLYGLTFIFDFAVMDPLVF